MKNVARHLVVIFFVTIFIGLISCSSDSNDPSKSSAKKIISFTFNEFSPAIVGTIDENAKTVSVSVSLSTNVTNLTPTIIISDNAIIEPASNIPQDFTNPVVYTVTAEDDSKVQYTVTVTKEVNNTEPITLPNSLSENTTLVKRNALIDYVIEGTLNIDGNALLTIEAGVKIAFTGVWGRIYVKENAGLKINGTAENPVIFTGPINNPNKGSWSGITVYSNRADNQWNYVIIENAGYGDDYALGLYHNAQLSLKNSIIRNSIKKGIKMYFDSKFNEFTNNTIHDCNTVPVECFNIDQTSAFDNTSSFNNNTLQYIEVEGTDWLEDSFTIKKLNVPYFLPRLTINQGELTIEPGVNLIFANGEYFQVNEGAILNANGTDQDKIVFTSKTKFANAWQGVFIYSQFPNLMNNCIIEYGGKDGYSNLFLRYNSRINISNTLIRESGNYGVIYRNDCQITSSNITFENCANGNVYNADEETVSDTLP